MQGGWNSLNFEDFMKPVDPDKLTLERPEVYMIDMVYLRSFIGQNSDHAHNEISREYKAFDVMKIPADMVVALEYDPNRIRIWTYDDGTVFSVTQG